MCVAVCVAVRGAVRVDRRMSQTMRMMRMIHKHFKHQRVSCFRVEGLSFKVYLGFQIRVHAHVENSI